MGLDEHLEKGHEALSAGHFDAAQFHVAGELFFAAVIRSLAGSVPAEMVEAATRALSHEPRHPPHVDAEIALSAALSCLAEEGG